jgi:hypothetical protein
LYKTHSYHVVNSIIIFIGFLSSGQNQLTDITTCTCIGYNYIFECNVTGAGATVWSGTVFDHCSSSDILLRHSQYESGSQISSMCSNSGPVIGRTIGVVNDSHVSQLSIHINQNSDGDTVQCYHDNGSTLFLVGSSQISFIQGKIELSILHLNLVPL